ncbi:MAG: hypothetical protein IPH07_06800 [Deltaproteobacteria bacterium]|nr:hypothetical protein [Deltaproteobacteria bacterium]MBK8236442.1 hypothetical protein [Deltaproteobacteria bacterium]MBK8717937.1 hypothetical protein [Deltaproteobacteria bacterium]MBP7288334.1 hypothetical protein [Nannocystaceae bacterium]
MSVAPSLSPELRARLAAGEHERVAIELAAAGELTAAAWVHEQIWDFAAAADAWLRAGDPPRALAAALRSEGTAAIDRVLAWFDRCDDAVVLEAAAATLTRRKRHHDAARLLARAASDPRRQAAALGEAGDRVAAAKVLADAGAPLEGLRVLGELGDGEGDAPAHALAAALSWDLGDAEAAARHAQAALRHRSDDASSRTLLARALTTLGHGLAAEIVLPRQDHVAAALPGRFRVTGTCGSALVGAAYVGVDRTTLQEVEIHLLLADLPETGAIDAGIAAAIQRFATAARAAAATGHPAIRPVLELREDAGLLVLPRAGGPTLRTLIRPPGLGTLRSRARASIAFLLEGLQAAHARGLVHGAVLPSSLVTDALGRPLLGPFGAHHLQGLAATHTGAFDELLACTAPEVRAGAAPTQAADMFATGVLLAALVTGELRGREGLAALESDAPELRLALELTALDPAARPDATAALARLSHVVSHVRELEARAPAFESASLPVMTAEHAGGITLEVAASWSDAELDALCAVGNPWWQPVLDRDGRTLVLAAWPPGCRSVTDELAHWRELVPEAALATEHPELAAALGARLHAGAWVVNAAGQWMLALDDLLRRDRPAADEPSP